MLDDEVLLAYEKIPLETTGLPMFNLGKGAAPRDVTPNSAQVAIAQTARSILGLRLCAVDIIETTTGKQMILEVNDGIMMEYYSRHSDGNKQKAMRVYEKIVERMFHQTMI